MSPKKTASSSGKRTRGKGSAPSGDSFLADGGELHQIAGEEHPALTTNQGVTLGSDKDAYLAAAKTSQWDRKKNVRTLA
jgi:catalase